MNLKRTSKYIFYTIFTLTFIFFLHIKNWLIWVILGLSILYLIVYFTIGTLTIFYSSITELGPIFQEGSALNPLLTIFVMVPIILAFWLIMLVVWPLFLIPDENLRKNEKYDAISAFEKAVKKKYRNV